VTRATRAGLPTLLAVSGWRPLALAEDGGPLFAEASTREFVPVPEDDLVWDEAGAASLAAWDAADETTTERAGAILAADTARAPRVSFVYLGTVDFAGHATGTWTRAATAAGNPRSPRRGRPWRGPASPRAAPLRSPARIR
jgi:hypothetical protein